MLTAILKASDWLNGQLSSALKATRFPRGSLQEYHVCTGDFLILLLLPCLYCTKKDRVVVCHLNQQMFQAVVLKCTTGKMGASNN